MSGKTKAIIAVIVAALCVLGYFFINTTVQIEKTIRTIGVIAIVIVVIALAVFAIIMINKIKKAKDEHDKKKALRKAREIKKNGGVEKVEAEVISPEKAEEIEEKFK